MPLFELNRDPSTKELRWFSGLWFPAFCALLGLSLWRRFHVPEAAIIIWILAVPLGLVGLVAPRVIRPVYRGLIWITYPLGWIFSNVLLFLMYFVVITPLGSLIRMFHDPMSRKFDRDAQTYWVTRTPRSKESYTRQL